MDWICVFIHNFFFTNASLWHWEITLCYSEVTLSIYVYRQISNISRTLVGHKITDYSDVVGASPVPVGAAPTISSFSM